MKKILALAAFLVVAAACSTETTNREMTANTNKPMVSTSTMSDAEATAREKATWEAIKKKDYDAFGNMLASDYIEVEDDGVYDKTATSTTIKDFAVSDATFSDWKVLSVDKNAVLVTYNLNLKATYKGQAVPPGPYRVASGWVNRDGKW